MVAWPEFQMKVCNYWRLSHFNTVHQVENIAIDTQESAQNAIYRSWVFESCSCSLMLSTPLVVMRLRAQCHFKALDQRLYINFQLCWKHLWLVSQLSELRQCHFFRLNQIVLLCIIKVSKWNRMGLICIMSPYRSQMTLKCIWMDSEYLLGIILFIATAD